MRKTIFFLFLLLLSVSAMAQKHCISGYVMDAASRETLITPSTSPRPSPPGEGDNWKLGMGRIGQIRLNKTNKNL